MRGPYVISLQAHSSCNTAPELQIPQEPSTQSSGKRKRVSTNPSGLYKSTETSDTSTLKRSRRRSRITRTQPNASVSRSPTPHPAEQSVGAAADDSDVEIIDVKPLKMDQVVDMFWSMSAMPPVRIPDCHMRGAFLTSCSEFQSACPHCTCSETGFTIYPRVRCPNTFEGQRNVRLVAWAAG